MESFEVKGNWWIPTSSIAVKVPGILKFDPASHAQLLICTKEYRKWNDNARGANGRYPILVGVSEDGEDFTLLNSLPQFTVDERCGPYFQHTVGLVSDFVVKGQHFERTKDIVLDEVRCNYTYLTHWLVEPSTHDESAFIEDRNAQAGPEGFTLLRWQNTFEPFSLEINDGQLEFCSKDSPTFEIDYEVNTTPKFVRLQLTTEKGYRRYMEFINVYLRNFLCLAAARPIYPAEIVAKVSGAESANEIRIYFCIPGYDISKPIRLHEHMLFRFRDVQSELDKYFLKWLADYELCRESHDVYFDHYFNARSAPTTRFLLLAQALEGYHRELYNGKLIDEGEYRSLRRALEAVTNTLVSDQSFKDIFRSTMEHGNDYTFRRRLKHVSDTLIKDHINSILNLDPRVEKDIFIKQTVDTRNAYTHRSQDKKGIIEKERIPDYARKLNIVIMTLLLTRMGFPPHLTEKLLGPFVNIFWIKP